MPGKTAIPRCPTQALALAIVLFAALAAGCTTVNGLRPGANGPPSGGVTMLYAQKPEAVFNAAQSALALAGLRVLEVDPNKRYILAERGVNTKSNGENVGVYLSPEDQGTKVTVVSRRKVLTNVLAKDFAMPVHLELGALLGRTGN